MANPTGLVFSIDAASSDELGAAFQGKLDDLIKTRLGTVQGAFTGAMGDFVAHAVRDLRADILAGGFANGAKLAKIWHGQTLPANAPTLEPAGWFWNKATDILDAFTNGVTITVRNAKFLAIPLGPAAAIVKRLNQAANRSRNAFGKFVDEDNPVARVERQLGVKLIAVIGRDGDKGVLVPATPLTLTKGGRTAKHQTGRATPLFLLVHQATLKKRIKGAAMLTEIQDRFEGEYASGVASRLPDDS